MAHLRTSILAGDIPDGLEEDERPVAAGGFAVLDALFHELGIEQMKVSNQSLRDGVLYELAGSIP